MVLSKLNYATPRWCCFSSYITNPFGSSQHSLKLFDLGSGKPLLSGVKLALEIWASALNTTLPSALGAAQHSVASCLCTFGICAGMLLHYLVLHTFFWDVWLAGLFRTFKPFAFGAGLLFFAFSLDSSLVKFSILKSSKVLPGLSLVFCSKGSCPPPGPVTRESLVLVLAASWLGAGPMSLTSFFPAALAWTGAPAVVPTLFSRPKAPLAVPRIRLEAWWKRPSKLSKSTILLEEEEEAEGSTCLGDSCLGALSWVQR